MATTATEERNLKIREITLKDAAAVAALSGELGYEASVGEMKRRIEDVLPLAHGHAIFVACLGDEVVGWGETEIVRHIQTPPHALITGLVVRDGVRSIGVGRRLCAEIESWARRQGIGVVRVTSRMTRERAHRFYLREGYTQIKMSAVFEKEL